MEIPASDAFHRASLEACPNMLDDGEINFELMRTEAVLGMLCLQHNDVRGSHRHMHRYLGMSAEIGFHSESRWGSDLTAIEIEERRRLVSPRWPGHVNNDQFWHQYHLDVQLAVTFGSSIRHREAQCNVAYPAEVYDDEDIRPDGVRLLSERGTSLIKGWNLVTDLYRILEHVVNKTGVNPPTDHDTLSRIGLRRSSNMDGPSAQDILKEIGRIYDDLPIEFKMPQEMTGDAMEDRYGFQGGCCADGLPDNSCEHPHHDDHVEDDLGGVPARRYSATMRGRGRAVRWAIDDPRSIHSCRIHGHGKLLEAPCR
jgi:hypothetical protein